MVIWYIQSNFGVLYPSKSGNPGTDPRELKAALSFKATALSELPQNPMIYFRREKMSFKTFNIHRLEHEKFLG
jgi:hypothetical protein